VEPQHFLAKFRVKVFDLKIHLNRCFGCFLDFCLIGYGLIQIFTPQFQAKFLSISTFSKFQIRSLNYWLFPDFWGKTINLNQFIFPWFLSFCLWNWCLSRVFQFHLKLIHFGAAQGLCTMGIKVYLPSQLLNNFFPQLLHQAMSLLHWNPLGAIRCMRKGPVVLGSH
jgi:hypothetical protein